MSQKADIVFITTAIAIMGGVFSLIQTGFLDPLNSVIIYTYYPPQLIMLTTASVLLAYILGGFAGYKYTGAETREMIEATSGQLQKIANDYSKSIHFIKSKPQSWKQSVYTTTTNLTPKSLPRPDQLALSLKINKPRVYGVNAAMVGATNSLGAPIEIKGRQSPNLKLLIPITMFQKRIWGRAALILIIIWAALIITGTGIV
jgi:hypothetical protein